MSSLTPERFARLHPVHHMIFDYLSQSSPYLVLRLNKYHRRRIIPNLYHTFTITTKSLGAFDCGLTGEDPLLPLAINQVKVLRVVNTESAILFEHLRLRDDERWVFPLHLRDDERGVFPLRLRDDERGVFPSELKVVRVEFSWAVIRDGYFLRIQGRLGDVGKYTILEEVARSDHLAEALVHVDCGDEWASHDSNELGCIPWMFHDRSVDINTTIVLHAPTHGRIYFPLGERLPLPSPSTLRFVLWSTPEKKEQIHPGDPRPIPIPPPGVLEDFARFIALSTAALEQDWVEASLYPGEVLEEGFVYPLAIEVVCPSPIYVEELARTFYRPDQRKAKGFDWAPRFRKLDRELVDNYDLWSTKM
ncbi:hypothetical protein L198_02468 [Cryptococcus wingfieldii CBS 7118]|uniref:Uncharacterized protein n=1 Tax=Cryptococcus wingfieldii CBS 7118 TaxID=1295528 RepID=A0A1E3JRV5_9TREE|nr:hypothetical protein L198_02468 [Cryptococcus wingfieldii CBS 7118]ODO03618.1 hypothetical protein L198_02468 [Cryptococcus wingfieldii CBS 7118]